MNFIFISVLLCFCSVSDCWSQKRLPVLHDIYRIQDVAEPDIAPDGKSVAYSVHQLYEDTDESSTNIWLVSLADKRTKQLTFTQSYNNFLPKWSPDGKWIAYLSDGGGELNTQIWLLSVKEERSIQLTQFTGEISDFSWSPDSKELVFVAQAERETTPAKPIVIDRYQFKEDESGYLTNARNHLYLFDIKSKNAVMITSGTHDEFSPSWSPDGASIAYVSKRGKDPDRNYNYDIFLIKPHHLNSERQLTHYQGSDMDPDLESNISWSPDSAHIVYLRGHEGKWSYYAPSQLAIVNSVTGEEEIILPIDKWFYKPKWAADGKSIYTLIEGNRNTYLNQVDLTTGRTKQLTHGLRFDKDFTINKDQIILLSTDDVHPPELFLVNTNIEQVTKHNASLLKEVQFQSAEDFTYMNDEGLAINGLLMKPAKYRDNEKLPSILYLHGGPVDQFSHEFDFDLQQLAANGYVVIAPNPRGSSGRGLDFAKAIYADWGNRDVKDVLGAVDYFIAQGFIDPKRLAVGGWSYGGMLTDYVIASDNRFKAALSGAGTANILANYGVDQYTYQYEQELGKPWVNPQAYLKLSYPFIKSYRIKTPTLFMCGALDFNVPCEGSEQLYQALKSLNIPTQLIIYPEEHHVLEVPSYIVDRLKRYTDWLDQYLS